MLSPDLDDSEPLRRARVGGERVRAHYRRRARAAHRVLPGDRGDLPRLAGLAPAENTAA